LNINKIDNGYIIEYQVNITEEGKSNWDSSYTYHKYAFQNWDEVCNWLAKNEDKVDY